MLVVIAYYQGDRMQAQQQATWIAELGGVKAHDCLLVPAMNCDTTGIVEPLREAFRSVQVLPMWEEIHGWPRAAGVTWSNIAQHIQNPHPKALPAPQPWLWLEPDAIPLVPDWMDKLEAEYVATGKPMMGAEVDHTADGGRRYVSGVAIYPMNTPIAAGEKILDLGDEKMTEAFDPYLREQFLPIAHLTKLIQHIWVTSRNPDVAPTFPDQASLGILWPEAVLFHRNKDGTLVQRLREKRNASEVVAMYDRPVTFSEENAMRGLLPTPKSSNAAQSDPVPAPTAAEIRCAELEAELIRLRASLGPKVKARRNVKRQRTPAEQEIINERMAKIRAARKAKV